MNKPKPIQIFKPGKHVAMSGAALSFSESDLAATAAAYDPAKHEAPLVVGHPRTDKPRFGGVGSLVYADGFLDATPKDVDTVFAEWVEKKYFNQISASFYSPDSPSNPVPGVYYLRHVGFLGAQPPAVKGLNQNGLSFSDAEEGVVEFTEWDDVNNASLWRSLREWIIGKFGQDEADKVVPGYTVKNLELSAEDELKEAIAGSAVASATAFVESQQPKGEPMSDADKARLAALETENAALKAKEVVFAEAEKKRASDVRHADHAAFAEGLIKEGKLLPAHKDVTVATLDFMAKQESVVEFGEGDAKKPLVDAHKAFLLAQPKQVEFAEVSGADGDAGSTVEFAAPDGMAVDKDRLAIHNKALAYAEKNKTTYTAAVAAVSK